MKYNKIIGLSALSLAFVGLWGCTSEVDYAPAEQMTNPQVFFASNAISSVDLQEGQNTAVVNVSRANKSGSVTVDVTSSAVVYEGDDAIETDIFSVPSSVTFADGQDTAPITISFDFNEIKAETEYVVTLDIAGESLTPYGKSQQEVTITYAPWSEWSNIGQCFYTNASPWGFADYNPIYKRTSLLSPNLVQYDVYSLFVSDYSYIINVDESTGIVTIPVQETGAKNNGNNIMVCDSYTFYTQVASSKNPDQYKGNSSFNSETGVITIETAFYFIDGGSIRWWGLNYDSIQLPGYPNYDIAMNNKGTYINEAGQEFTILSVVKGGDVASYAINLVQGSLSEDEISAEADKMIADTELQLYNEDQEFQFPVYEEDYYTCIAVAYGADGLAKGHSSYTFYNELNQVDWNAGWTTVTKKAEFSDVFFAGVWWANVNSWEVEVQQNDSNPGYYRIVKPYGSNPYGEPTERGHYYIAIDATNPDAVTVKPSLTSYGYYVLSAAPGKLVDGTKFVFPANSLGIFNGYNEDGSMNILANWGEEAVLLDLDPVEETEPETRATRSSAKKNANLKKIPVMKYSGKSLKTSDNTRIITKKPAILK